VPSMSKIASLIVIVRFVLCGRVLKCCWWVCWCVFGVVERLSYSVFDREDGVFCGIIYIVSEGICKNACDGHGGRLR